MDLKVPYIHSRMKKIHIVLAFFSIKGNSFEITYVRKVISYKLGDFDPVMERISSRALIRCVCRFRGSGPLSHNAIQIGGHAGGMKTNVHHVHSSLINPSRTDRSREALKREESLTTSPPPSCLLHRHRRPLLRPPPPPCCLLHWLKVSLSNP
jgi:hypothetical protein